MSLILVPLQIRDNESGQNLLATADGKKNPPARPERPNRPRPKFLEISFVGYSKPFFFSLPFVSFKENNKPEKEKKFPACCIPRMQIFGNFQKCWKNTMYFRFYNFNI